MNISTPLRALAWAVCGLATGLSLAADPSKPKTRAEVKAELEEAIRTGDLPCGEDGRKPSEVNPSRYPSKPPPQGKTREEVRAELEEAIRRGDVQCTYDNREKHEVNPSAYPAQPKPPGASREQVREELREAVRTGDMPVNDEGGRTTHPQPSRK